MIGWFDYYGMFAFVLFDCICAVQSGDEIVSKKMSPCKIIGHATGHILRNVRERWRIALDSLHPKHYSQRFCYGCEPMRYFVVSRRFPGVQKYFTPFRLLHSHIKPAFAWACKSLNLRREWKNRTGRRISMENSGKAYRSIKIGGWISLYNQVL